ncbi:hypothetical protein SETIT_9G174500v2 [Setaria italica]|uniref:Uncharacterized protein n=1 Tax=Setaria italica TaxID=4555 RepID=A0A368SJE5_SETIT|nr:hypothetical protein SETIT_9G174500v2 [Setaria italica]
MLVCKPSAPAIDEQIQRAGRRLPLCLSSRTCWRSSSTGSTSQHRPLATSRDWLTATCLRDLTCRASYNFTHTKKTVYTLYYHLIVLCTLKELSKDCMFVLAVPACFSQCQRMNNAWCLLQQPMLSEVFSKWHESDAYELNFPS